MPEEKNITKTALSYQIASEQSSSSTYYLLSLLALVPCITVVSIIGRCIYSKCCYKSHSIKPLNLDKPSTSHVPDMQYLMDSPRTDQSHPDNHQSFHATIVVNPSLLHTNHIALSSSTMTPAEEIKRILYPFGEEPVHVSLIGTGLANHVIPRNPNSPSHAKSVLNARHSEDDVKIITGHHNQELSSEDL